MEYSVEGHGVLCRRCMEYSVEGAWSTLQKVHGVLCRRCMEYSVENQIANWIIAISEENKSTFFLLKFILNTIFFGI